MTGQDRAKAICNDLGDDLVKTIAQGNGSVIIERGQGVRFRNKSDKGRVEGIIQ